MNPVRTAERLPRIGFVILVWNSARVIGPCLESVLRLRGVEPLVALVDNGCTDDTMAVAEQAARACGVECPDGERLTVLRYDVNQGTTVPRNAAIRALEGRQPDYWCILDSDTVVNDAAFAAMIGELRRHPRYGIIGPRMATSGGVEQMSARAFPTLAEKLCKGVPIPAVQRIGERMERQDPPAEGQSSWPVDYLMSACWLVRPEALRDAGLLDERIFYAPEDAEYCLSMWKAGWQVAFCPGARIVHEWQRLSKKKLFSRMNWEHIKGLAYMFRKHGYLFSAARLRRSLPGR